MYTPISEIVRPFYCYCLTHAKALANVRSFSAECASFSEGRYMQIDVFVPTSNVLRSVDDVVESHHGRV